MVKPQGPGAETDVRTGPEVRASPPEPPAEPVLREGRRRWRSVGPAAPPELPCILLHKLWSRATCRHVAERKRTKCLLTKFSYHCLTFPVIKAKFICFFIHLLAYNLLSLLWVCLAPSGPAG